MYVCLILYMIPVYVLISVIDDETFYILLSKGHWTIQQTVQFSPLYIFISWAYRLERLARMAEKIQRESKQAGESLHDLERQIQEAEVRGDKQHPYEAKHNCDAMDRALHTIEENLRAMFRDVQTLQDNHFPQSEQLYTRFVVPLWLTLKHKPMNLVLIHTKDRLHGIIKNSISSLLYNPVLERIN